MNIAEREAFNRWFDRAESAGIPVSGFELAVVRAHAKSAFAAGIRFEKRRAKTATPLSHKAPD